MRNTQRIMTWAVAGLVAATTGLATVAAAGRDVPQATAGPRALTGTWKAQDYKVTVSGDLETEVWGRGASKVRRVELTLELDGDGILRVRNSVVYRKGVPRPYSSSVVEVRLKVEMPATLEAGVAAMPGVRVLSAEERYLDDPNDRRTLDGLTVSLHIPAPESGLLNLRFDTAQGTGSFGETLSRPRAGTAAAR